MSDIALTYNFQHKSCPLILTISVYEIKGKMYKLLKGDFNQIYILLYNYINYITKQYELCICYNKKSFFFYFQRIMIAYILLDSYRFHLHILTVYLQFGPNLQFYIKEVSTVVLIKTKSGYIFFINRRISVFKCQ